MSTKLGYGEGRGRTNSDSKRFLSFNVHVSVELSSSLPLVTGSPLQNGCTPQECSPSTCVHGRWACFYGHCWFFQQGHLTQIGPTAVLWELEIKTEGLGEKWQHTNLQVFLPIYSIMQTTKKRENKFQRENIDRSRYTERSWNGGWILRTVPLFKPFAEDSCVFVLGFRGALLCLIM